MDTIAHGLWTFAVSPTRKNRSLTRWRVFFGMFPDLVWLPFTAYDLLVSRMLRFHLGPYDLSHSLIVWFFVTAIASLRWRRAIAVTWPWALHVLIDIPGHIDLPTPFLWPLSSYAIRGAWDWLAPAWLIGNYIVLAAVFTFVGWRRWVRARRVKTVSSAR